VGVFVNGLIGNDYVTATSTSATFDTKNVGNGKTVTVTGITLGGADAGDYSLNNTTITTTANITVKDLTVTGLTAGKVYDGTPDATLGGNPTLVGIISPDVVTLTELLPRASVIRTRLTTKLLQSLLGTR